MDECKSNGGIKAIYLTEAGSFSLVESGKIIQKIHPKEEKRQTINMKILSPGLKKMVKWLDQEIKDHERAAEEYAQELDNPEMCDVELGKAEALEKVKEYIATKL